jgi:thiol-disulfide isomerase/thioredoxin
MSRLNAIAWFCICLACLKAHAVEPTTLAPSEVKVVEVDAAGFQSELAKHKGKVVFVDFWATYCAPCIKRFPHTVAMQHEFGEQGLVVISFSIDDLEDLEGVKEFLAKQNARFPHLISKFGIGQETADAFDVSAVPDFRLYDREGKLRYRWKEQDVPKLKDETIVEHVKELIAEKK